jgi:hypothetical protein
MNKKILFLLIAVLMAGLPAGPILASYDTITWGTETVLYFSGVAANDGGQKGISISIFGDTYLNKYTLDTDKLVVELYPGSKINLKSTDRKMFRTDIATAETVCADGYSTFSYSTPETYANFTITLSDTDNCPAVTTIEKEEPTAPVAPEVEQIDVTNLEQITVGGLVKVLDQNSKTNFVYGKIVETIEILSVGTAETKIKLSSPAKEFDLKMGSEKIIDTDADGWNDLSLTLKSTNGGKAELTMKITEPVKVAGINPGDLVKVVNGTTVYYVGANSKLYVFPNEKTYKTWYSDFGGVKTIDSSDLAKFGWGGLVTYRPGARMVKFSISPAVYVVDQGGVLYKLKDENMAKELYGDDWNKKIDDINEAFMFSYNFGNDLARASDYSKDNKQVSSPTVGVDKNL